MVSVRDITGDGAYALHVEMWILLSFLCNKNEARLNNSKTRLEQSRFSSLDDGLPFYNCIMLLGWRQKVVQ